MKYRIGITFLSFGKDVFAGIEYSLYDLALGLLQIGSGVAVYSGLLSGSETEIDGIPVYRSRLLPKTLPDGDNTVRQVIEQNQVEIREELKGFVRKYDISHLYVCDPLWGVVQPSEAWRHLSIPIILSLHVPNTKGLLEEAARVPYLLRTVTSGSLKKEVDATVRFSEELVVVPNSVDLELYRPADEPPQQTTHPIIFCNGRISPEKGTEFLIMSLAEIAKRFPGVRLRLCDGDYPFGDKLTYLRYVLNIAERAGVSQRIELLPKLRWNSIPELIRSATVVVLPSLRETFGRAALEALASGIPLVCTNVGNLPALTEGVAPLVPPSNVNALAESVIEVLENLESYRRRAAQGVAIAKKYSNVNVARQLLDVISTFRLK